MLLDMIYRSHHIRQNHLQLPLVQIKFRYLGWQVVVVQRGLDGIYIEQKDHILFHILAQRLQTMAV